MRDLGRNTAGTNLPASSAAFAVGVAEAILTCPKHFYEKSLPCTGIDDEVLANGIVTATPISSPSLSKLQRRAHVIMPHIIESTTTTIPAKKPETTRDKYHHPGNLKLRRKTWQVLAMTLGRQRNGNSRGGKNLGGPEQMIESGPEILAGPYPLPRKKETKKMIQIKVDVKHLCSPSCRGGPKPPSWYWQGPPENKPEGRGASGRPVVLEVM